MKRLFFFMAIAIALYSCGGNNTKSDEASIDQLKELEIVDVNIDSLIANPKMYANQTVRFSAMVDHVCKHSGQKLTIVGTTPEAKIKVMGTEAVPSFEPTLDGKKVEVVGFVKGMATEQVETCEHDSTTQVITYAVECKTIKSL